MDIGQLISDAEPLIRHYGVLVVTVVLTFESLGAPLPGESLGYLLGSAALAPRNARHAAVRGPARSPADRP